MGTYLPEKNAILSKQYPCRWLTWSGTIVASQSEAMIQNTVHQLLLRNQQRHSKAWMLCWLKQWHIVVIIYTNTSLQANNLIQFTQLFQYSFEVISLTSFGLSPDMICTSCVRRRGEKVNTGIYQNPVWKKSSIKPRFDYFVSFMRTKTAI